MKRVMSKRILPVLLSGSALVILAVAGCSDQGADPTDPGGGAPPPVSFAANIQPIFDNNCAGCHGAGGNGGLDLRPGESYANLVGTAAGGHPGLRVTAGDPDASVLYLKLTGAAGVGSVMPPAGSLGSGVTDVVWAWISEGAQDN